MTTRQALKASLAQTPPAQTREAVMANLRQQAHTQLELAARFFLDDEFEDAARACGYAKDALTAYVENAREDGASRATVREASSEALKAELQRRVRDEADEIAAQALKLPLPSKKEKARGRS